MTRLKLHHDGWLALPPAFRHALGLGTGDPLEAELVDGAVVLRPAAKAIPKAKAAVAPGPEQDAAEDRAGDPTPATQRKPGRARKAAPVLKLEAEDEPVEVRKLGPRASGVPVVRK